MKQTVEAERAIKNEAVKQLTTLTDEAYRVMFKEVPKFYKVTCPANTNCTTNPEKATVQPVDKDTQTELANAPSGAVLAVNGIDNPLERAGQLAMQNAEPVNKTEQNPEGEKPHTIYLMHYVPANNGLSELMIAAYEKSLASTLGYSNQDEAYAAAIQARGQLETTSLGHSRGTIVQTNANNMLGEQNFTNPNLSVRGVGGAVTGETYTAAAQKVTGDDSKNNITFKYFINDPVPVVAGGNPGVISLAEFWKVLSTSNSAHSCYGTGAAGCAQVEILTPKAPDAAIQNNSKLIQYIGGKPYDASGNPLTPTK
jgi:filamentous hemagglutinin